MNKIILTLVLVVFTTMALANQFIHYSNRPGNMLVKTNDGIILASFGNGKAKLTKTGNEWLYINNDTEGKLYLNSWEFGNLFSMESIYFPSHRATLHLIKDKEDYLTVVSVTIKGKPGFAHEIDVMKFIKKIEMNLDQAIMDAEMALEQALRDGANEAVGEAAVEAAQEALNQAISEFTNFESSVRDHFINKGISQSELNTTFTGQSVDFVNGSFKANYKISLDGSVSQAIFDGVYQDDGTIVSNITDTPQANIKDANK